MKTIPRSKYDPELKSGYLPGRIVTWVARRKWGLRLMHRMALQPQVGRELEGLLNDQIEIPSSSTPDHSIRTRIYKPSKTSDTLPAMLYIHGGGFQVGVPEQAHDFYNDIIAKRDIAIFAPAYRLSLYGSPYPAGLNDCLDTLIWMKENAAELGIRPDRFVIAGHSGGGGLTAALTHKVIDGKLADIAFQMPVYPMLDHRMRSLSAQQMMGSPIWDKRSNALGWNNYIGHLEEVPEYASPALRKDMSGLPPTISFVGDLEPFKDETIDYIEALKNAGVSTRFKLYQGAFHAFELMVPDAPISKDANAFQLDAFEEFYDTYIYRI